MDEELDFDYLAQQYGFDYGDRTGELFNVYQADEALVRDNNIESRYGSMATPSTADQAIALQSGNYHLPPPADPYEAAALSRHFDFYRAEAEGLVAKDGRSSNPANSFGPPSNHDPPSNHGPPSNRGPPSNYGPPSNHAPDFRYRMNEPSIAPVPAQERHTEVRQRSQNQQEVWVEPEPGRRVQLFPVSSLRECLRPPCSDS